MEARPEGAGSTASSTELLGFAADARVLIVNCDDLGMYRGVNVAVVQAVEEGVATSDGAVPVGIARDAAASRETWTAVRCAPHPGPRHQP